MSINYKKFENEGSTTKKTSKSTEETVRFYPLPGIVIPPQKITDTSRIKSEKKVETTSAPALTSGYKQVDAKKPSKLKRFVNGVLETLATIGDKEARLTTNQEPRISAVPGRW